MIKKISVLVGLVMAVGCHPVYATPTHESLKDLMIAECVVDPVNQPEAVAGENLVFCQCVADGMVVPEIVNDKQVSDLVDAVRNKVITGQQAFSMITQNANPILWQLNNKFCTALAYQFRLNSGWVPEPTTIPEQSTQTPQKEAPLKL